MELNIRSTITLNNGVEIPRLGLGVFRAKDGDETVRSVLWALEAGYRHIDTAAVYGNEEGVGRGMRESGLARKDIFLTTKLWNDDMRASRQREAFKDSLKRLGTDYIDLYLIHWPVKGTYKESWKVMEQLYKEGLIRAIGVSNFHRNHLDDLLQDASVVPAVNQVECHPLLTQADLKACCDKLGIVFESWSPLGGSWGGNLADSAELSAIGKPYGKTAAQVILRWHLQRDLVVIPKSVHKERIVANADLYDFALSAAEMAAIDAMNRDQHNGAHPDTFAF
jgi:diketogulonate reductase-like aldo/keto reductase